jgi:arylsulfatase A-like enzyme
MRGRLQTAAGIGVAIAAGESLAALSLWSDDLAFLAAQAVVAFAAGLVLALAPIPERSLFALPVLAAGLFHGARILREGDVKLGVLDLALLALQVVVVTAALRRAVGPRPEIEHRARWRGRALAICGCAYVAQALWCARLAIPNTLGRDGYKVAAIAAGATLAPALAAWLAAGAVERSRRGVAASIALALLALPPLAFYWPWLWRAHEQGGAAATARAGAPDVILIVLDTARADRMSLYGHDRPTTPALERFASEATVYDRAQSQGIWTLPGHASLFTGLYPSEHKADWLKRGMNCRELTRDAVTLAERFDLAGYRTACIAANKAIFGRDFGLTQGFEVAWAEVGSTAQLSIPFLTSQAVHSFFGRHARERIGAIEQNEFASAREVNRLALAWLDSTSRGAPRFLVLNYMEAHGQLRRPPCAAPRFGEGRAFSESDVDGVEAALADRADPDPADLARVRDWYDSQLACLDLHVGELLDALRERGLLERAIVVVTSDHGHMLGEHRAFKHQAEVWQGLAWVPLIVKLPGKRDGGRCAEPVETADLAFALPRWAGLGELDWIPAWAGSASMLPPPIAADGEARDSTCPLPGRFHAAVSEAARMGELAEKYPWRFDRSHVAFVEGSLKLVVDSTGSRWASDLGRGPLDEPREPTPEESARIDLLLADWRAQLIEPPPTPGERASREEEERRLRALHQQGYVGD